MIRRRNSTTHKAYDRIASSKVERISISSSSATAEVALAGSAASIKADLATNQRAIEEVKNELTIEKSMDPFEK